MAQSSNGETATKTTLSSGQFDVRLMEEYKKLLMSSPFTVAASAVMPEKQKPSQPFSDGARSYLFGALAAMCAGVCRLENLYVCDGDLRRTGIVAEFKTPSGKTSLVKLDLAPSGQLITDDWFLELKARIVMECGE